VFCECPFALHDGQPEKDKQNVDFAPLEKFLWHPWCKCLIANFKR